MIIYSKSVHAHIAAQASRVQQPTAPTDTIPAAYTHTTSNATDRPSDLERKRNARKIPHTHKDNAPQRKKNHRTGRQKTDQPRRGERAALSRGAHTILDHSHASPLPGDKRKTERHEKKERRGEEMYAPSLRERERNARVPTTERTVNQQKWTHEQKKPPPPQKETKK